MYGYEIVQALKETIDDNYEMSKGTLYPALKRLENQGFISSYWTEQRTGRRRKYYRITEKGHKVLAWQQLNKLILK